jgi:hypothetical protein
MLILYLLQAIVPLVLIAWLVLAPPRSEAGFWTQAIATGVGLVAIGMTGVWAFPPWWTVYASGALLLATVLLDVAKRRKRRAWPDAMMGWISLAGFAALGLYAGDESRLAIMARRLPDGPHIALSSPLGPGVYLVVNGGNAVSVNAHATMLDESVARHWPYRGTGQGVDLVALDRRGLRADGIMPADPERYVIFGRSVIAPCPGGVIAAVDGLPDMPVPEVDHDHLAGNHVILRCAGTDILLGHFRNGSLLVGAGQSLARGQPVAQVGNSGNTSEPHLHINAMRPGTPDAPYSGAPIPITVDGRYLARNDHLVVHPRTGRP